MENVLNKKRLVLASNSPRRKELLTQAGIDFKTLVSQTDEKKVISEMPPGIINNPASYVACLAEAKAKEVLDRLSKDNSEPFIVLGADTVVSADGKIIGKPKDRDDAVKILKLLSGRTHQVYTGVAILGEDFKEVFCEKTDVTFYDLTDEEIEAYILTNEPFDKAGAYGIQGYGAILVKKINGDYNNVVGLPLAETVRRLRRAGI